MTNLRHLIGRLVVLLLLAVPTGCAGPLRPVPRAEYATLRERAVTVLKAGIGYEHNPVVRVEAIEALEALGMDEALPWIRSAMLDEHAAVRFAACVAVGRLKDGLARRRLEACATDEDASVQVAALFALHQLGDTAQTGRIATHLLFHEEVSVRRNAALVLGLMGEEGAVKVLARAMRDGDAGVRQHALEAMARIGNRDARQELTFMANTGIGSEEVFAINVLSATKDRTYVDTFRYKLETAAHRETRLAAARALGVLGSAEGFDVAINALQTDRLVRDDPNDPAPGQVLRVRLLALGALGAVGRPEGLAMCSRLLTDASDPRVQVAAAKATLEILAGVSQTSRARPAGGGAGEPNG